MTTTSQGASSTYASAVLSGSSEAVGRLRLQVARIAPHFRIALLTGEPGSGKHAVASHLHSTSPAAESPLLHMAAADFVAAGCPAQPNGISYLPGLESLSPAAQNELVQALRKLSRDTRVIFGCLSDPRGMVAAGRLRQDLYERITTLHLRVPPLRERSADLPLLTETMLRSLGGAGVLSPEAVGRLQQHPWQANMRELYAMCERLPYAVARIEPEHLPTLNVAPVPASTARLEDVMLRHVMDVLESCSGNKLRAAELLGISRSTLYRMLGNGLGVAP